MLPPGKENYVQRLYGSMQMCPKCRNKVERLLALSRTDNKTMVCNECGTKEVYRVLVKILTIRQLMREPEWRYMLQETDGR